MESNNKQIIHQINALRIIAIILIFMGHCYFLESDTLCGEIYSSCFIYSDIWVEFFFILSGFMASYTFSKESYKNYIVKRINRFFPIHWACLVVGICLSYNDFSLGYFFKTLLSTVLLQSLFPNYWYGPNGGSWFLSTLFILALFTPTIINFITRIKNRNHLLLILILSTIFSDMQLVQKIYHNPYVSWFFYVSPFFRFFSYFSGLILGIMCIRLNNHSFKKSGIDIKYSTYEIISFFLLIELLYLYKNQISIGYFYSPILIAIIFLFFKGRGILSSLFNKEWCTKMSKYGLAFYLVHFPIVMHYNNMDNKYLTSSGGGILIVFILFLLCLLFSYFLCEKVRIKIIK